MKTKKLNKRVLAWLMTVMLCMSGMQVGVFATETDGVSDPSTSEQITSAQPAETSPTVTNTSTDLSGQTNADTGKPGDLTLSGNPPDAAVSDGSYTGGKPAAEPEPIVTQNPDTDKKVDTGQKEDSASPENKPEVPGTSEDQNKTDSTSASPGEPGVSGNQNPIESDDPENKDKQDVQEDGGNPSDVTDPEGSGSQEGKENPPASDSKEPEEQESDGTQTPITTPEVTPPTTVTSPTVTQTPPTTVTPPTTETTSGDAITVVPVEKPDINLKDLPQEEIKTGFENALAQIPSEITSENIAGEAGDKVIETYKYFDALEKDTQTTVLEREEDKMAAASVDETESSSDESSASKSDDVFFDDVFMDTVDVYSDLESEAKVQVAVKFDGEIGVDMNDMESIQKEFNQITATNITAENILSVSNTLVTAAEHFTKLTTTLQSLWYKKAKKTCDYVFDAFDNMYNIDEDTSNKVSTNLLNVMLALTEGQMPNLIAEPEGTPIDNIEDLKTAVGSKGTANNYYLKQNIEVGEALIVVRDITLDLAGRTLSYASGFSGNMFEVNESRILTIKDSSEGQTGTLKGIENNTGSLVYVNGGIFNLEGGTLKGNHKGMVPDNPIYTTENRADSKNFSGAGVYVDSGTFNMSGGTISGNHTIYCDVEAEDIPTDYSTSIDADKYHIFYNSDTLNPNDSTQTRTRYDHPAGQGGGVYVKTGTFNLSGGTISSNHAGEGGGIFIYSGYQLKNPPIFNMTGGTVDGNIAHLGEGGGIYIQSDTKNLISSGSITNNKTKTAEDLGGGGIYIENSGKLQIINAEIKNNDAYGLGGGIAACVHGKTSVVEANGAVIHDNTNTGEGFVRSRSMNVQKTDRIGNWSGYIDCYNYWNADGNFKSAAKDFFSAGSSDNNQGVSGAIIKNVTLGGGIAKWKGFSDGKEVKELTNENDVVYSGSYAALTSAPTNLYEVINLATVIISGNRSTQTHGGGIGVNGILLLGATPPSPSKIEKFVSTSLDLQKHVTGIDDEYIKEGNFIFELYSQEQWNEETNSPIKEENVTPTPISTINADGGKATIYIPGRTKDGKVNFFLKEKANGENYKYDQSVYKIVVNITSESKYNQSFAGGEKSTTEIIYTPKIDSITKIVDENGNKIKNPKVESANYTPTFTNTTITDFTVEKNWKNNSDSLKPSSITVQLMQKVKGDNQKAVQYTANGYENPVTIYNNETWRYTFENLPKYNNRNLEYEYSVEETEVVYDDTAANNLIEYWNKQYNTEYTKITVQKQDNIFVILGKTKDNKDIILGAWQPTISDGKITNTWIPATDTGEYEFTVNKFYKDDNGENQILSGATFTLTDGKGQTVKSNTDDSKTNSEGKIIFSGLSEGTYTLEETAPPEGYTYTINGAKKWLVEVTKDSFDKFNIVPENGKVTLQNNWNLKAEIFALDKDGNKIVKNILGSDKVLKIENKPIKGTIEIKKEINTDQDFSEIEGVADDLTGDLYKKEFTFDLYKIDGETISDIPFSSVKITGESSGKFKDGKAIELPYGKYFITESNTENSNYYQWNSVSYSSNETESHFNELTTDDGKKGIVVNIEQDGIELSYTAKNEYELVYGKLQVIKTAELDKDLYDYLKANWTQIPTLKFTVTGPNCNEELTIESNQFTLGEFNKRTQTGTIIGYSNVLDNLIPGNYTVTEIESSAAIPGYAFTVKNDENVKVESIFTDEEGKDLQEPTEANVINNYAKNSILIRKSVQGDNAEAFSNETFYFNVIDVETGNVVRSSVAVKGNGTVVVNGLEAEKSYRIVEINGPREGYNWQVEYRSGNNVGLTGYNTVSFSHGGNASVVATNTYDLITGSLKIEKHVTGLTLDEFNALNDFDKLTFDVIDSNGEKAGETSIEKSAFEAVTNENGETYLIGYSAPVEDLKPGDYTVRETNGQIDGYRFTVTGGETAVPVIAENEASVLFTNAYELITGSLKIEKHVTGLTLDEFNALNDFERLTFDVKDSNGVKVGETSIEKSAFEQATNDNGETYLIGYSAPVEGLRPGNYTVEEANASIGGYNLTVTGGEVSVTGDNEASALFTNAYAPITGGLVIEKRVTGLTLDQFNALNDFEEFRFIVNDSNGTEVARTSIQKSAFGLSENGEYLVGRSTEINGLKTGSYTVSEDIAGDNRWNVSVNVGGVSANGATGSIDVSEGENPITFTNTYRRTPSGGGDPTPNNPSTPSTPDEPTPVVDVPDPDTPLAELPEPDVPLANIPEEDTPLSELPEPDVPLANIPDEETPLVELPEHIPLAAMPPEDTVIIDGDVPKTGDMSLTIVWMLMCLLALSGITAACAPYLRRRRK